MSPQELQKRIETLAPGTRARVNDLTGTQDHYHADVVSPVFEGKLMIQQHRLVYGLLKPEMDSGEVHALSLKTYSPAEAERLGVKL